MKKELLNKLSQLDRIEYYVLGGITIIGLCLCLMNTVILTTIALVFFALKGKLGLMLFTMANAFFFMIIIIFLSKKLMSILEDIFIKRLEIKPKK